MSPGFAVISKLIRLQKLKPYTSISPLSSLNDFFPELQDKYEAAESVTVLL